MKKTFLLAALVMVISVGLGIKSSTFAYEYIQQSQPKTEDSQLRKMFEKANQLGGKNLEDALKSSGFSSMEDMHDSMSTQQGVDKMQKFMKEFGTENMRKMHEAMTSDPELAGTVCH